MKKKKKIKLKIYP